MQNSHSVLLVEDDSDSAAMLSQYLQLEGFEVLSAANGQEALELFAQSDVEIVLLDVMMPQMDGFETLRRLRQQSDVPVLMVTARNDDIDTLLGLELGADDYLAKPYNPRELVARIRAVLRRHQAPSKPRSSSFSDICLDSQMHRATVAGEPLTLTQTEFQILAVLINHSQQVVSKQQLSEQVLGRPLEIYDRSLDVHISNLRKKLSHSQVKIATTRAVGYHLEINNG